MGGGCLSVFARVVGSRLAVSGLEILIGIHNFMSVILCVTVLSVVGLGDLLLLPPLLAYTITSTCW